VVDLGPKVGIPPSPLVPVPHSIAQDLKIQMIRDLEVVGEVPDLEIVPAILPVIVMGTVLQQTVRVVEPAYRSTDVFSQGVLVAPANGTTIAGTGALPAGIYDVMIEISASLLSGAGAIATIEHRDAADATTLAEWSHLLSHDAAPVTAFIIPRYSFGYELAQDERLRIQATGFSAATTRIVGTIFARIR